MEIYYEVNTEKKSESMRREIVIGLVLALIMGYAVYFKLWSIDSELSIEDREYIRKQFDIANKEAMDESAEWRLKYDQQVERSNQCRKELTQIVETVYAEAVKLSSAKKEVAALQKENTGLLERVESLTQKLQAEKLKCGS